jgi:hypothetical protein
MAKELVFWKLYIGVHGITVVLFLLERFVLLLLLWSELSLNTLYTKLKKLVKIIQFIKLLYAALDVFYTVLINMSNLLPKTLSFKLHFTTKASVQLHGHHSSLLLEMPVDLDQQLLLVISWWCWVKELLWEFQHSWLL